jgi:hypothetical protein
MNLSNKRSMQTFKTRAIYCSSDTTFRRFVERLCSTASVAGFYQKTFTKKLSAKSFCQKALIKTLEIKHGKKLEELT